MLTASIVTYHTAYAEIRKVVECVLRSPIETLYIVDNSRNDALRRLERLSPRIRYIHNVNIGYGGAHNIAICEAMEASSDYHVVINPDIYFADGVIETLTEYMDNRPEVGWVMPKVVYPNGDLQYLCKLLPTPFDLILRRFVPEKWFHHSRDRFELRHGNYNQAMNIPYLSGCFMFLRVAALREIGLFDERYFMYGEDIDLSRRMHAQYRTMYYPEVSIVHAHEKASYKSRRMMWIHIANIIKYFNKWGWFMDGERRKANKRCLQEIRACSDRTKNEN